MSLQVWRQFNINLPFPSSLSSPPPPGGAVPELWHRAAPAAVLHRRPPAALQHDGVPGGAAVQPAGGGGARVDGRRGQPAGPSRHLDQNTHNLVTSTFEEFGFTVLPS